MSTPALLDEDEVRLATRRAARRDEAIAKLEPDTLIALAGAPFWTPETMSAAGLDFAAVVDLGRSLVQREGDGDESTLTLHADAVGTVLGRVQSSAPERILGELGARLAERAGNPPVLARWAEIASTLRGGANAAASILLAQIRDRCDAGELGEATELIEAAGALARVVVGPFAAAERVGRHRVERAFRLARDRRHLSTFVGRDEAMQAFEALLAPEGVWALHYVGVGGAGKTTFIRHLAFEQAEARGLSVARIDFDYLSPAYPGRDPGQLIAAIVHELTVQIERIEQDRWLQSIHEQLERLRLVAREVHDHDPLGPIAWPEFRELLSFVGSFLHSFKAPLIILDTCEELMKLAPVAGKIPSVEATFRMLEELHALVPDLRVIFAGRRLLAAGGSDWSASASGRAQALTDARPYLALHELRGMTKPEADEVLQRLLPEARRDDALLAETIRDACPEDARVTGLADATTGGPDRYSPFRLVRFARWVAAEPAISVDKLGDGPDPYIEQRIVQRMGPLEELLPVVAILRRFDAATLATVRGCSLAEARATINDLSGHEWIDIHDVAARGNVIEAKPSIREPLELYLRAQRPAQWHTARRLIGDALAPQLTAPDAVIAHPELIDAALRALPEETAVRHWLALERQIGTSWGSALSLTRFLLGESNAAADASTLFGSVVRATHVSALIHEQPDADVTDQWRQIAEATEQLDPIETVRIVRARARLGAVAAAGWAGTEDGYDLMSELDEASAAIGTRAPVAVATCVLAAVEGLLERLERDATTCPKLDRIALGIWLRPYGSASPGLRSWMNVLRARAHALLGNVSETHLALDEALAIADGALPATCLDWLPPTSLRERVRLETLRLRYYEADEAVVGLFSAWEADLPTSNVDDDSDRLLSAIWQRRVDADASRAALGAVSPVRHRSLGLRTPAVYRRFPSAAVTVEAGRVGQPDIVHDVGPIDRLRLVFARARRRRDPSLLQSGSMSMTADSRMFIEAQQALAVTSDKAERLGRVGSFPGDVVDHWSYQRTISRAELTTAVDAMRDHVDALNERVTGKSSLSASRALATLEEVVELSRYTESPLAVLPRPGAVLPFHPDVIEGLTRLALRAAAIHDPLTTRSLEATRSTLPDLVGRLAIEEAELLSLRFPDRAARLFDFAATTLDGRDPFHATVARLNRRACDRALGKPSSTIASTEFPALEKFERRVADPKAIFPPVERASPREPLLRDRARAWGQRRSELIYTIVGLLVGFGLLVIGGYLLWALVAHVLLPWVRTFIAIPFSPLTTLLGCFAIAQVAYSILKAISTEAAEALTAWPSFWRAAGFRAALRVKSEGEHVDIRLVIGDPLESRAGKSDALGTFDWTIARPRSGEKASLSAVGDATDGPLALEVLHRQARECGPWLVLIRGEVARGLGPLAWEAAVTAGVPQLVMWRAVPHRGAARIEQTIIGEDGRDAWLKGSRASSIDEILGIAHHIARPSRTVGGVGLVFSTRNAGARVDVTVAFKTAKFDGLDVVLQLEPQDQDQASSATRTEIGLLRELAVTLIERGARSVIVLPAVAHDEVAGVVTVLARAMGRRPKRSLKRLAKAVRLTRAHIAKISHGDHPVIAGEITLFIGAVATDSKFAS